MQAVVHRVAVLGQLDRRLQDLAEAHGSKARQRRGPGAHHGRHAGWQITIARNQVDAVLAAPFDRQGLGRPAHPAQRVNLALLRRIDQRRNLAGQPVALRFQQVQAEAHRRRRVDRVAALLHHPKAGRRRQVMTRRHHPARPHHHRSRRKPPAHPHAAVSEVRRDRHGRLLRRPPARPR